MNSKRQKHLKLFQCFISIEIKYESREPTSLTDSQTTSHHHTWITGRPPQLSLQLDHGTGRWPQHCRYPTRLSCSSPHPPAHHHPTASTDNGPRLTRAALQPRLEEHEEKKLEGQATRMRAVREALLTGCSGCAQLTGGFGLVP